MNMVATLLATGIAVFLIYSRAVYPKLKQLESGKKTKKIT